MGWRQRGRRRISLEGNAFLERNTLPNSNVSMIYAKPAQRSGSFYFSPALKHRLEVPAYLPSQKEALILGGRLGIMPGSELETHSLEMIPSGPIKKLLTMLPRNEFLDILTLMEKFKLLKNPPRTSYFPGNSAWALKSFQENRILGRSSDLQAHWSNQEMYGKTKAKQTVPSHTP